MANVLCSIELEPRTLSQGQITQAMEVAADVVQKLEPSEASALFIEGLMHPIKEEEEEETDEDGGQVEKIVSCIEKGEAIDEKACQCLCATATIESPYEIHLNQPLSAPF